ncbi:hypothetical protein H8E88_24575 [candidate division KSB1 bacterium]|nr:hypothetical protein [candidate division KSB1 bacterium]
MDQAGIITAIRRAIKEPSPVTIGDIALAAIIVRGVKILWLKIKEVNPDFCIGRKSISSNTNVFDWPSDCLELLRVWNMLTNAEDITGATEATPCVLTLTATDINDDDIIRAHDVGGMTGVDGTWLVDNQATNTIELVGSTGVGTYTSGGKAFVEKTTFTRINRRSIREAYGGNTHIWYPRGKQIVIDKIDFSYDIIIDYIREATQISDIPNEYHEGLISFGVSDVLRLPDQASRIGKDLENILMRHDAVWEGIIMALNDLKVSSEPQEIPDVIGWDYL